jgi:hypothetical protein
MTLVSAFTKADKPIAWSTPNGELIQYVDVKLEFYANFYYVSNPRGTESPWFQSSVWLTFFEGNQPRWIIPHRYKLNFYANRVYVPIEAQATGFELWFMDGIKPSAWAFIQ